MGNQHGRGGSNVKSIIEEGILGFQYASWVGQRVVVGEVETRGQHGANEKVGPFGPDGVFRFLNPDGKIIGSELEAR